MELDGARVLVAGATGALGSRLARALAGSGAQVALAGRHADRRSALARELGGAPAEPLELLEPGSAAAAVHRAADALCGLDGLVVATGCVAFGEAAQTTADTTRELFAVNALGPIALVQAALERFGSPAAVVALSAVVAEFPTAGMAAYSASKAALSAYLAALRRERRRHGLTVLDVRPGHLETPFAQRALAGEPPRLPAGADPDEVVAAIVGALRADRRELAYDLKARALVAS